MKQGDGADDARISVRRQRRVLWTTAVVSVVAGVLAAVAGTMRNAAIHGGDWRADVPFLVLMSLVLVVPLLVVLFALYTARRGRLVAVVHRARPGALVIPAYSSRDLWDDATAAGVDTHGIRRRLTTTLAVALVGEHAEIWILGDRAPRWSVDLAQGQVTVVEIDMGQSAPLGLRLSDGTRRVSFVPHYGLVNTVRDLERALVLLGEEPADHLTR